MAAAFEQIPLSPPLPKGDEGGFRPADGLSEQRWPWPGKFTNRSLNYPEQMTNDGGCLEHAAIIGVFPLGRLALFERHADDHPHGPTTILHAQEGELFDSGHIPGVVRIRAGKNRVDLDRRGPHGLHAAR